MTELLGHLWHRLIPWLPPDLSQKKEQMTKLGTAFFFSFMKETIYLYSNHNIRTYLSPIYNLEFTKPASLKPIFLDESIWRWTKDGRANSAAQKFQSESPMICCQRLQIGATNWGFVGKNFTLFQMAGALLKSKSKLITSGFHFCGMAAHKNSLLD